MAENDIKPDDDSSLDQFEQKLIEEEKKKARKNFIISIAVLMVVAVAGFILYGKMGGKEQAQAPLPPPPVPKVAEPQVEAPTSSPTDVKPAVPAPKKEEAKKVPTPAAKKEEKAPAMPGKAPAPTTKKEDKPVAPVKAATAKQPAPAPAVKPEPKAPTHSGGYTIQLGVFTEEANVKKLTDKLAHIGLAPELGKRAINVKSIVVTTNKYRYRELADKDAKKLSAEGYKNTVRITGPGSYAVEVGRYASSKEADAVVKKLEDKGYTVHVDFTAVKAEGTVVLITGIPDAGKLEEVTGKLKNEHLDFFVIKP